ncbi:arginine--tRNA ligase [Niallia sp. 03091]|uniref:arginine--tRNA ligase n=1 Tax=unclassified Niallia TaxID=2837522 RepID=UPI0040448B2A
MNIKNELANCLVNSLQGEIEKETIISFLEKPKLSHLGDYAFPCFPLAKRFRKAPQAIAEDLAAKLKSPLIDKVEVVTGYVNIFLKKPVLSSYILKEIMIKKESYGQQVIGNGGVITVDFSSPNIAKPFSMGHLRSTVIGNSLAHIAEKNGYKPVRINHLGDWGTQFGKLMVAYQLWGDKEKVKENPIKELLKLYVAFHEEAEKNPQLNDQGRYWFKKLEDSEEEAVELWKYFREESVKEFNKVYQLLGITFDSKNGEAFYNDKMDKVIDLLEKDHLLLESEGAKVVQLDGFPPCLIKKKDGTTLYATRDLAAAIYRQETYQFVKAIYVVGNEQTLHFKQLFAVLNKMGYDWQNGMVHIPFGMMLKDGKKMSTRKGKVVLLEEVLNEAIDLACQSIEEKNPSLQAKEEVAIQVGTGAVIFHDLKHYRLSDIEFSLHDMLRFEGETGPYVQYTHARACSLLRKGNMMELEKYELADDISWNVIKVLLHFPEKIKRAMINYDPSEIAKYVLDLSKAFNKYYASTRILEEDALKQQRLALVYAVTIVLKEGLRLLGIEAPEEM